MSRQSRYARLGSNGRDYDEEYHDPYRPNASPLPHMPNPEDFAGGQRIHVDTRDRLLAQPTYSIDNLAYSHGQSGAYEPSIHHERYDGQPYEPNQAEDHVYDDDTRPMLEQQQSNTSRVSIPIPVEVPQWATVKTVSLYRGNLVLNCPVPMKLYSSLSVEQQQLQEEMKFMRYSAATCDPAKFVSNRFTLRQKLFATPRDTELFIVVTMYNEEDFLLARTLVGVFQNINYMEKSRKKDMWGEGSWKKIVVCIVSDGAAKINKKAKALLAALGVYQADIEKGKVNNDKTVAHVFEYTTQMEPSVKGESVHVQKGNTPVQLLFCLKQENAQKINSHRWFFQAFAECLQPNVCVLLDAGTMPGSNSIYKLWNAFDQNRNVAGACGEIKAQVSRRGWAVGSKMWNPLVATQNFEYKMSNILDKPLESAFGFISVLPGAFSAYRWVALQGEPIEKYFAGEKMHDNSNFFTANMYLAEDRILCYELVAKKNSKWILQYVKNSTGETDVPTEVHDFIGQRRRWLNGSFFAAVYTVVHFYKLWQSGHSFLRKIMLTIEIVYQIISMIFAWFALANFYLVFKILVGSLGDPLLLGKPGLVLSAIFEWSYVLCLIACFILSMGNVPKATKKVYIGMVCYWAVVMAYLMFATVFVTVKSVQSEVKKGFKASDLFHNKTFSTLILSMLSTYVLWFVVSFLFFDAWHMFTSFIQYLLLTPTYINILNVYAMCNTHDLSWGTKGAESAPGGGSVKSGKNSSEVEVVVPADPNTQYDNELELLALVGPVPPKPMTEEEKRKAEAAEKEAEKKAKYQILRSWVVMAWLFSNLGLITAVLRAGSIGIVSDKAITKEAAETRNTGTYLFVVLWSVAGLSAFRFIGSCWFLVHRKFVGV